MSLRPLLSSCLALAACASLASAQSQPIPAASLAGADLLVQAFDVGDFSLQSLQPVVDETGFVAVPVVLDGVELTLGMAPYSLRAPDYQLLVTNDAGELVPGPYSAPTTYRGAILELPGSRASGSFVDGKLEVLVVPGKDAHDLWGIQHAASADPSLPADQHVVYRSSDLLNRGWECGGAVGDAQPANRAPTPDSYSGSNYKTCEIACDADFEYYESNNSSVSATEGDIENIINRTEGIYEVDVEIFYEITTIIVRTNINDPYSSTSPNSLLNQFDSHWSSQQQGVQRDIAHLFTGKDIDGGVIGIAKLSQICSQNNGFGLSQSKFSNNIVSRTALTAHELGHNWSAQHCNGQSDCGIMCSGLGGCTGELQEFGNGPINQILNEKNSSGCLADADPPPPPQILGISPASASAMGGEDLIVTGDGGFLKVNGVTVDGVALSQGFPDGYIILNDTRISFPAPVAQNLGPVDVVFSTTFGDTNAQAFTYEAVVPPVFTGPPLVVVSSSDPIARYQYGTLPTDSTFFILAFDNTQFPFQGHPLLVNLIFLAQLPVNAAGVGELSFEVPVELLGTLFTWYTQMAFYDTSLKTISPVVSTAAL